MKAESNTDAAKVAAKVAIITGEIKGLTKDGRNPHHQYDYVSIEEATRVIGPLLAEHKLAVFPGITAVHQNERKTLIECAFTLMCGETGASVTVPWAGEGFDTQDKGVNKAIRAALKYFLLCTFMATTGDEPEADAGPGPGKKQQKQPQPQQAKAEVRESGKEPQPPNVVRDVLRSKGGWIKTATGLVRDSGENAQPIAKDTQQHSVATLMMALAFEKATDSDIADNAKLLLNWLYGVETSTQLSEQEGQAIKYAWLKTDGALNEYAKTEAIACLEQALEEVE